MIPRARSLLPAAFLAACSAPGPATITAGAPTGAEAPVPAPASAVPVPASASAAPAASAAPTATPEPEVGTFALDGPFKSRAEGCAAIFDGAECGKLATVARAAARQPYVAVDIAAADDGHGVRYYGLFVQMPKGHYATKLGQSGKQVISRHGITRGDEVIAQPGVQVVRTTFEVPKIEILDVIPGDAAEIVLSYSGGKNQDLAPHELIVCGAGPSGAPSCSEMLSLAVWAGSAAKGTRGLFGPKGEVRRVNENGELLEVPLHLP